MRWLLSLILTLLVLFAFFFFVDAKKFFTILLSANPFYILLSIFFLLLMNVILTARLSLVFPQSFKKLFFWHMESICLAELTPGMLGYYYILSKFDKKTLAFSLITAIQIIDVMVKLFSFLFLSASIFFANSILVFLLFFLSALLFLFLFYTEKGHELLLSLPLPFKEEIRKRMEAFLMGEKLLRGKKRYQIILTLLSWVCVGFAWYFSALAVGIKKDLFFFMIFQAAVTFLVFLPIPTIAGAGIVEASAIYLLPSFSPEKVLSFMLLIRGLRIITYLPFFIFGRIKEKG